MPRKVSRHPTAPTGVSFVTHSAAGHKFDYLRKNSAASLMTPAGLPADYIAGARFFHLSAIGQAISDSARRTCDAAIAAARAAGVKVSYDTNLRLRLWDLDTARRDDRCHHRRAATSPCRASTIPGSSPASPSPTRSPTIYLKLGAPLVALKMAATAA